MSVELKIKSKSLDAEAKIIKLEEKKFDKRINKIINLHQGEITDTVRRLRAKQGWIKNHRQFDVRKEARATFLARAFIKGMPYSVVENHKRKENTEWYFENHIIPRVASMSYKYDKSRLYPGLSKPSPADLENMTKKIKEWAKQ